MATVTEIKIIDAPAQSFEVTLEGLNCRFDLAYSQTSGRWSFDLALQGEPVIAGRAIVPGVDLLSPFHLGIGQLVAQDQLSKGAQSDRDALPAGNMRLYHVGA